MKSKPQIRRILERLGADEVTAGFENFPGGAWRAAIESRFKGRVLRFGLVVIVFLWWVG